MERRHTAPSAAPGEAAGRATIPTPRAPARARDHVPLWTGHEIATVTGGDQVAGPDGAWSVTDVGYYPDEASRGRLLLTTCPSTWGHRFPDTGDRIPDMIRTGASAILTQTLPAGITLPDDRPVLTVENTRAALDALGRAARSRFIGRVICVAGDEDRATVRSTLAHVLSRQAPVIANERGYGGARGVALSLARTPPTVAYGVYEVSTSRRRRALAATRLARPHVIVVTDVERASSGAATDKKAEVFKGLEPAGVVVINRDLPRCDRLMLAAVEQGAGRVITYGTSPMSDVRLVEHSGRDVSEVRVTVEDQPIAYMLPSPSRRLVMSTLAALATAHAAGADWRRAARSFTDDPPPIP